MSSSRSQVYTNAGVNIEAGNDLVSKIKSIVATTHTRGVLSDIGSFGGLFRPNVAGMKDPILVASTDGVGTKLKLAFEFNKHDTVGIDLVAMSVNDILVQGAEPLFFLDYYACSKLDVAKAQQVIAGIAEGCRQSACTLLGGETAEMPGMYADEDYDLAGFCVGLVDNESLVDGSEIKSGDVIIGIQSSGVHSNGYSLVRKIFAQSGAKKDDIFPGTDKTFAEVLLEPTIIYVECLKSVMREVEIKGMVHVTGGGFYDNIPRVLPQSVKAVIDFGSWDIPPVFNWLKEQGGLSWAEMLQIFNSGIGYILILDKEYAQKTLDMLAGVNMKAWQIGSIAIKTDSDAEAVQINF